MLGYLFGALFFVLPLIFYPKTSEVFEFNKIITLYLFTVLICAGWLIKMIQQKKVIFRRTIVDIPLTLFLISQVIATIFSIDVHTSIFGYYSRFNGGLLSLVCYALLYWAFVSNLSLKDCKRLMKILLVSATLVAAYGILEHFGHSVSCLIVTGQFDVNCWVQDVQARVFATLGQPNWLSALLTSLVPLTWYYALQQRSKNKRQFLMWIVSSILLMACIWFTKSRSGILALGVALMIFGFLVFNRKIKMVLVIGCIIGVLFLIINFKNYAIPVNENGGTESADIRKIVWEGALNVGLHNPLIGTGVETFAYSYWQYRPLEHNNTSEWDFLYNKAHNEYLNYFANTGILGLMSYGILIVFSLWQIYKSKSDIRIALLAGYVSILVTNFFGFSVVTINLLFFLFPALAVVSDMKDIKLNEKKLDIKNKMVIGIVAIVAGSGLLLIGRYWYGDLLYQKAKSEAATGQYTNSVKDLQTAIEISKNEAIYHNEMARTVSNVALAFIENNEATTAAKIIPYALNESKTALTLAPRNINIRQTRISMFLQLYSFDKKYLDAALALTNETSSLSPTDPKMRLLVGKIYVRMHEIKKAKEAFDEALKLKPDYEEAKQELQRLL